MYIVTFYSFKGGVGRSLALANVGAYLALTGRKVLLVDFDLEAPGLDTFSQLDPKKTVKGVVDYVCDYVKTGTAPRARDYVYECPHFTSGGGHLWIMPAGSKNQPFYSKCLSSIDWQGLYSEQNGYLMFEDLKSQWAQDLMPDYVLVDSRTGYTDVAGICTRQLPDAVVILFFPNEQNLGGLPEIVRGIREEATGPQQKTIQLHFVTANVPDLDDEDQILAKRLSRFKRQLGYEYLSIIHHYPSLALLNQIIFTQERPKSRLAKEYRNLCRQILRYNLKDREGALSFLRTPKEADSSDRVQDLDKALEEIAKHHATDAEVLGQLGNVYAQLGRNEWALNLYDEAISHGYETSRLLVNRAHIQIENKQDESAIESAEKALALSAAEIFDVNSSVRILMKLAPQGLKELPQSPALASLSPGERLTIILELMTERNLLPVAEEIFQKYFRNNKTRSEIVETELFSEIWTNKLVLCQIGQRKFPEAMATISPTEPIPGTMAAADAFNYGMAFWGATGNKPIVYFNRVVECDAKSRLDGGLNSLQCASIAYWMLGNIEEAMARLIEARQMMISRPKPDFSAWRYLQTIPKEFQRDLDEMEAMIKGASVLPEILL